METLETYSVTIVTSVTWDMEWVLRRRRLYGKILFPLQLKPFIITQCNCTSIGLCNTKKTWLFPSGGRGSGVAGIGLAVCWVSTGLGQLEAAEELVRLGRKCCNRLRQLLSLREAFRKALHSWSKQAAWRNWSVEEGNFVCLCLSSLSLWARGGALTLSGWTSHINQLAAAELHSLWLQSPPEWAGAYVYIMWAFAKAPQIYSPSATTTRSSLYETLSLCCWTSHRSGSRPHSARPTHRFSAACSSSGFPYENSSIKEQISASLLQMLRHFCHSGRAPLHPADKHCECVSCMGSDHTETYSVSIVTSVPWDTERVLRLVKTHMGKCLFSPELKSF